MSQLLGTDSRSTAKFAQVATNYPSEPLEGYVGQSGFPDEEVPWLGANLHLDGCWNGGSSPLQAADSTPEARSAWYSPIGTNGQPLEVLPGVSNIANYTLLVGIPLSTQQAEGQGNLALLKGAHAVVGDAFRAQRAAGTVLGPDGFGWPREDAHSPTGHGVNMLPPDVRSKFVRNADGEAAEIYPAGSGRVWPKPTFLKCKPGDCVIVLWSTPHAPSYVTADEPRLMVYFRITAPRPKHERRCCPEALCDIWRELPGMHRTLTAAAQQQQQHREEKGSASPPPPTQPSAQQASAAVPPLLTSAADLYAILRGSSVVRVRFHIIRNARIKNVGKSESCTVSNLRMICKQTAAPVTGRSSATIASGQRNAVSSAGWTLDVEDYAMIERLVTLRALCFDLNRSALAAHLYTGARIKNVGKYQACMVTKLRIICISTQLTRLRGRAPCWLGGRLSPQPMPNNNSCAPRGAFVCARDTTCPTLACCRCQRLGVCVAAITSRIIATLTVIL